MPAAVAKGIILSISIITALGIAVLENPQIQAWLEEQRQKIAELLRSLGEELDPQSRRAAEAFAFEGRTLATDAGIRREASGSVEAAAIATGRSLENPSTIRRIPVKGPTDPDEAEERRRKGREYLAKRNQQMFELQERRKSAKAEGTTTPPTPTSFDAMVDGDGKLKLPDSEKELPSPPTAEPVPDHVKAEMREVERNLMQPLLAGESSASASGWSFGSRLANAFSDEYALQRSETPKPPVPPKVALDSEEQHETDSRIAHVLGSYTPRAVSPERTPTERTVVACHTCAARKRICDSAEPPCGNCERGGFQCGGYGPISLRRESALMSAAHRSMPGSFSPSPAGMAPTSSAENHEELSYEEQLAIALSLSEAEAASSASATDAPENAVDEEDRDLRAAIKASLKDMNSQKAAHSVEIDEPSTPRPIIENPHPLVDLSPPSPRLPAQPVPRGHWETLFDRDYAPTHEPLSLAQSSPSAPSEEEDELYRVTPDLTRARLATLDVQDIASPPSSTQQRTPYDPVREAAGQLSSRESPQPQGMIEASFYSAASSAPSPASTHTMDHESPPPAEQLIDVSEDVPAPSSHASPHATSHSSFGFQTDTSDSDSDTFASMSRTPSRPRSEMSNIEVIDVLEDSDVDMLSEEGDGIATPDSWTEVGSRDGESEVDGEEYARPLRSGV